MRAVSGNDPAGNPVLRSAGVVLITASLGFVAVFSYLAAAFGYPDVLDRGAAEAAAASTSILERAGRGLSQLGAGAGVAAGVAMILGLVRWPTIEWALASHWAAHPEARPALSALFDASNLYLGNVIGEFAGEVALAVWFVALGVALRRFARPQ